MSVLPPRYTTATCIPENFIADDGGEILEWVELYVPAMPPPSPRAAAAPFPAARQPFSTHC